MEPPNEETQKVAMARALISVNPNNVCFGRGYPLISLQQGSLYKQLLKDNCAYYHKEVRLKSVFVEQRIVKPVHEMGGRFYTWDARMDRWVEAGNHETYTIVSQALRDEFKKMKKTYVEELAITGARGGEVIANEGNRLSHSFQGQETADSTLDPSNESMDTRYASVAHGGGTNVREDSFRQLFHDRASESVTHAETREGGRESETVNVGDGRHGNEMLGLVQSISSSESRLRGIREVIHEGASTGKFDQHLEQVKGTLASIDDGLTSIERAVGIRREAAANGEFDSSGK